ncbi:MAG: YihY/virulence factor BrkB family protein [Acidimicrobiales bacterium]
MNIFERGARRLDGLQQRSRPLALVFGVMKKFGDDNAGVLVSSLAYSAFGAVFPLLLLLITILGLVLGSHSALRHDILSSTLDKFPIIGNDLVGNVKAIRRHTVIGFVVGILGLTWGSMGLAQNGIFTMEQIWNLPGPQRPNYIKRLGRSVVFLAVLGVGLVLGTFFAAAVPASSSALGLHVSALGLAVAGGVASFIVNFGEYLVGFRVLTPAAVGFRQLLPGAALAGAGWTVLQALGGYVVGHYLKDDTAVYGTFAIVLGLFAWIYIIAELTVYAVELNVVLAKQLWPRALVNPPTTAADRHSIAAQALQNQRRPEQHIAVSFEGEPLTERQFLGPRRKRRSP